MLTKRQNFLETIKGGKPDRYVNQFEYLTFMGGDPYSKSNYGQLKYGGQFTNKWGITIQWPEGLPGPFPVHDQAHKAIKDITKWREQIIVPSLDFPQSEWDEARKANEGIDRSEVFAAALLAPGIFDMTHYLMGMDDALINFYEEPEAMHELIDCVTEWELRYAKLIVENLHPDAVFHHDDFGSQKSTFLSPDMFREFIFPSYKKIYGYFKANGAEVVIHHSDSYAATLIPDMIDAGIDVFQGCLDTNNIPDLIKKYGGKMSFMGGINNGVVDVPNWTPELIRDYVEKTCRECGTKFFIPCCTAGGPGTSYREVFGVVSKEIDRMSELLFK